ncbi:MAG TPA: terminase family protein [Rubrivivax sp.]|nr:terminase family protein [Rubrivivax sp.]
MLSRAETVELLRLDAELQRRAARRKWLTYYPDEGPLRRELYPKHLQFFAAGAAHRQRLMLAANRVGKTESVGLYELTLHLTGRYPAWWVGRRFTRPINAWAAGDTGKTVRDILQAKLLGPPGAHGTGVLPGEDILRQTRTGGVADAVDTLTVRHQSGGQSTLSFKSYDQRRESFQGTEQDVILLDEEPPEDIYTECLLRTMTNDGMLMLTFTPLMGLSAVVLAFLPGGRVDAAPQDATRFVVMATWDDVPHLDEATKRELMQSIPPFQRDARSKGVPQLGAGAIYPVPESDFVVDDFALPEHWQRVYGLDVGWNRTAAVWAAIDRDSDTAYLYSEHYRGQAEPSVHAQGIRARGEWIPGVIDPAARGRGQRDGQQLYRDYLDLGLLLTPALNAREAGIHAVWQRLSSGRLKVFRSLQNWLTEFRLYRRDEQGRVVKENDHAMDATRYLCVSGLPLATVEHPVEVDEFYGGGRRSEGGGWMG